MYKPVSLMLMSCIISSKPSQNSQQKKKEDDKMYSLKEIESFMKNYFAQYQNQWIVEWFLESWMVK